MAAPLLTTKLYIPPVRPEVVPRPRLIEHLDAGLERKLTLVSAPAGYGKTTLISAWLQAARVPFAWLSLDEGDNDPVRFFTYLIAALQGVDAGIGQSVEGWLEAPQAPDLEPLAAALINDGFPLGMTIPNEGSYGFVYTYNVANNAPNVDNAYTFLDAILASPEIGAAMTKASGFISTYKDASNYLTDLEKKSTSFPEEQLANLQFFRAEANEMKYGLVDPAVEAVKAA